MARQTTRGASARRGCLSCGLQTPAPHAVSTYRGLPSPSLLSPSLPLFLVSSPTFREEERESGSQDRRVTGDEAGVWSEGGDRGSEGGHRAGDAGKGQSTEMHKGWSPRHLSVYVSAPCALRPAPRGAVHSHRHRWAPGPGRHFGFFFSFVGLVSSASWSLLSFIIFLPSGVLKYQSWERGGGGG